MIVHCHVLQVIRRKYVNMTKFGHDGTYSVVFSTSSPKTRTVQLLSGFEGEMV